MKFFLPFLALILPSSFSFADSPKAEKPPLIEDSFDREELGKGWTVQTGSWEIIEGALRGTEIESDKHSTAARRVVETKDAVYTLRFRLSEGTRGFHFGFDPKRGSLDKKGHLFSVIVDTKGWKILKHVDKNRREEDPNEVLASQAHTFESGKWYDLHLATTGTAVTAKISGLEPLEAEHPTFNVPKPTLVFRVIGDAVEIDDLRVSVIKP